MGFVSDLLGFGDDRGSNFRAKSANILQPVDLSQIGQAYGNTQQGLGQQQAFIQALMGQGGIQNQANVFAQQQALANQLQGLANGTGPNPALQQLQNTTGQNVANQAALMGGQRGAGSNVGLMARQIGQQGAGIQQQAAGQGAVLAANQQLAGMNALQNQQALMGQMAGQQVGQQGAALAGYNQAAQGQQGNLLAGLGNYNNANVAMQSNMNNANAGLANTTAQGQQAVLGGVLGGIGSVMGLAGGGQVPGRMVPNLGNFGQQIAENNPIPAGPSSFAGQWLAQSSQPKENPWASMGSAESNQGAAMLNKGMSNFVSRGGEGLKKWAPVVSGMMGASSGGKVPGKAVAKGDSYSNDNVPAMLSPGEVVIPRSVMQSKDPVNNAAKFVAAVLAKNGMKR